jgi:beta-galactosidase
LRTTLIAGGDQVVDKIETPFGVRSFAFDADKGFLLNGRPYVIKGTCNHQDHAGVGTAIPDRLQEFRVKTLKEMGSNAYRTAHNPPTPELLDACDRLGMIVMDENRLIGSDTQHMRWLEEMIRRDRNHASVAIWSLGNEEFSTGETSAGARVAATMQERIKQLDPTRPITYNAPVGNEWDGINSVIEVRGWSYHIGKDSMDAYHEAHPKQPNVGSEQGSTVGTRGIYSVDTERGYVTAYDDNAQSWSNTAEQWLTFFDSRPWLSGGFVWTGFDYRGEPTPYNWPCINSHFGIVDTCGFPKDNYYYYQSWWMSKPVLHILPHWNWKGREGQNIDVRVFSNCDEVELFLNGRSLGKKIMKRPSDVRWSVPYEAGILTAKGYRAGTTIAETKVETTGAASAVELTPDRNQLEANDRDVAIITVAIKDSQGRIVPTAGNKISFAIEGPAKILGVGNGDPSCHEPDVYLPEIKMQSRPLSTWRWRKIPDPWAKPMPEIAASYDDSHWAPVDVELAQGPLNAGIAGVFRTTVNVSEEELQGGKIDLWFGKIRGNGIVYVNGNRVGPGFGSWNSTILDVSHEFHIGKNSIAVMVYSDAPGSGLIEGAALKFPGPSTSPQWSRSAFNGFAQIIVQSGKEPGRVRLTAQSPGLKPTVAEFTLSTAK